MSTLAELIRLGRPPKGRLALSVALGSLTVLLGVGLMSLAGYVISRAAEHPPILELTVAMVAVRACGIGRPIARYFDRLESHDLAFRVLARVRGTFFRALEPQVPARVEGYRRGDLLARMVDDVDAMQNLFLRGITPPLVAIVAGGVSVAVGGAVRPRCRRDPRRRAHRGGVGVPALAAITGGRAERGRATLRAELSAEIVDLLRGGPELVVLGADRAAIEAIRRLDAELARRARPERGRRRPRRGPGDRRGRTHGCRGAGGLRARDGAGIARPRARGVCRAPRDGRVRVRRPAAGGRPPTPRDPGVGPASAGDRRRGPCRARARRPGGAARGSDGGPRRGRVRVHGRGLLGAPRRRSATRARTFARARRSLRLGEEHHRGPAGPVPRSRIEAR